MKPERNATIKPTDLAYLEDALAMLKVIVNDRKHRWTQDQVDRYQRAQRIVRKCQSTEQYDLPAQTTAGEGGDMIRTT